MADNRTTFLKVTFFELLSNYTEDPGLVNELWEEIEENYSNSKRHYHTLQHLENVLIKLIEVKAEIKKWEIILFSLFYHDIIYNPFKSNNEEKSSELGEKRMTQISVSTESIKACKKQILATKSHLPSADSDTNYFTDADLSVLGQPWEIYSEYVKNVRKEYSLYPDLIYIPGRKNVLKHFLEMDRIFKTDFFYMKLEAQAKENLSKEMSFL